MWSTASELGLTAIITFWLYKIIVDHLLPLFCFFISYFILWSDWFCWVIFLEKKYLLRLVSIWSQTIADDRGSQIADRRRSQRELFPYNRRWSQAIAEPTAAYISDSGSVKITRALCQQENRSKQHGVRRGRNIAASKFILLLVNRFWNSLGTSRPAPKGSVFNGFI